MSLEAQTIALIPAQGFKPERKHSLKGLQWLQYLNIVNNYDPPIRHARNGGERCISVQRGTTVNKVFVDSYREVRGEGGVLEKHVYEFLGKIFGLS